MCGSQLKMQFPVEDAIPNWRYNSQLKMQFPVEDAITSWRCNYQSKMESQFAAIAKEGKLQNTQTQELRKWIETQSEKNSSSILHLTIM